MSLPPGSTIGVFGSGQLGRMLGLAAAPLGYRLACFGPEANAPAGQVAALDFVASYDDHAAVRAFVQQVDVVTFEFENVPAHVAEIAAAAGVPVRPAGAVLHTAQQRLREKGVPAQPRLAHRARCCGAHTGRPVRRAGAHRRAGYPQDRRLRL